MNGEKDNSGLYIALAGLAIVYFGIIRPTTNALGLTTSAADAANAAANLQSMNDLVNQVLRTQQPTKAPAEWLLIANQVWNDLRYTWLDDNKADATYQVCRVQNDADVALLIQKFGIRQEYAFGIPNGSPKNLPSFLTSNLSAAQLNTIRGNHSRKGIRLKIV